MCINDAKISLLVSCKKDSSVIDKDSYRDELPFVWSLANSSGLLQYHTTPVVHQYGGNKVEFLPILLVLVRK